MTLILSDSFVVRAFIPALLLVLALLSPATGAAGPDISEEQAEAESSGAGGGGASGLPLPRFVSVGVAKANMRKGPGRQYPIAWVLVRRNLPVEVIAEYEHWRKIRDRSGEAGWVHKAMLSGQRTAVIVTINKAPDDKKGDLAPLYKQAGEDSHPVLLAEAGAIGEVRECNGAWCELRFKEGKGWVRREFMWGVYPGEKIE